MSSLKPWFRRLIIKVHLFVDQVFYQIRRKLNLGLNRPITLHAYRGFGKKDYLYLRGRVLVERFIENRPEDSDWLDFKNSIKRLLSIEIRDAEISIEFGENQFRVKTDKEGFFTIDQTLPQPFVTDKNWESATVKLESVPWRSVNQTYEAAVLMDQSSSFGIISDIDDTILKTDVNASMGFKMFYLTFFKGASKRVAFDGVGAFFSALHKGPTKKEHNPILLVSKSPWNLYDLLVDFLSINKVPKAPMMLRDYGLPYEQEETRGKQHKFLFIKKIFEVYADQQFVLVGDSGEKDLDLYIQISQLFPNRVLAIFIREVQHFKNRKRFFRLLNQDHGIPVYLVKTYAEAQQIAATLGLLSLD